MRLIPWTRHRRTDAVNLHLDRLAYLTGRPYRLTTDAWEAAPTFGFDFLADAIAKVILESQPQLTLAVYGKWGVGKTTLLEAVRERLASPDCAVAWFDMWEYKNQTQVIAHLLDSIADVLPKESPAARGLRILGRSALASTSLTTGAVTVSGKDLLDTLENVWSRPKVETSQLQHYVDTWRRDGHNAKRRIVVVVDNLDRCLPGLAAGLLEQITSLFGFPGVVFLLAAEQERLACALETKHALKAGEGDRYLEKIVQVEFRVPTLDKEHVISWIRTLAESPLDITNEEARLIAETAKWNPRQIKRLLNNVRIQLCTSRQDVAEDGGAVLASTLLLHHAPKVWLVVTGSSDVRKALDGVLPGPN